MEDSQVDDMADDLSNIQLTPAQQAAYQAALDSNPYITDGQRARLLNIITGCVLLPHLPASQANSDPTAP